jgi:hypothetical protein
MSQQQDDDITFDLTKQSKTTGLAQASLQTKTTERFASSRNTTFAMMARWLIENAYLEHWNAPARLDSNSQETARIAPKM